MISFCRKYSFKMNLKNPGQSARVFLCDVDLKLSSEVDPMTGFSANLPEMDEWTLQAESSLAGQEFASAELFLRALLSNYSIYSSSCSLGQAKLLEMGLYLQNTGWIVDSESIKTYICESIFILENGAECETSLKLWSNLSHEELKAVVQEIKTSKSVSISELIQNLNKEKNLLSAEIKTLNQPAFFARFHLVKA